MKQNEQITPVKMVKCRPLYNEELVQLNCYNILSNDEIDKSPEIIDVVTITSDMSFDDIENKHNHNFTNKNDDNDRVYWNGQMNSYFGNK